MGAKLKELKKPAVKLDLGQATMLNNLIPNFKTPTYAAMQKVDAIMKLLGQQEQARQAFISEVFKKYNIPEGEFVDPQHPLYYEIYAQVHSQTTELTQQDLQQYTLQEFNSAVHHGNYNYQERKLLEFWLVKPEKGKE